MPPALTCPSGHHSEWPEYCSVCGIAMAATAIDTCPTCDEPRIGPFCEVCGHSYHASALPVQSPWCAVVTPDRAYFDACGGDTSGFTFPDESRSRSIVLTGAEMRIGRRSASRGIIPEINLAEPPADPGVSHKHARLLNQLDGTWAVVDDGSTNGTYLNSGRQPIPARQQVPLTDGSRVHLGVWTTITLRHRL